MLTIHAKQGTETYLVSFGRGELILEELEKFLQSKGIDAGFVISGVGSLDMCNLYTVTSTGMPIQFRHLSLEGPLEVGALQGTIAGGKAHIHLVVHDVLQDKVHVGHLEPGSRCCYRFEMGLIALKEVRTHRVVDEKTGLFDILEA